MAERVAITESLLDTLADAISTKSGESTPLTLAEMTDAVNGISAPTGTININSNGTHNVLQYATAEVNVPSGAATLQSKSKSYTPTESAQTETVSADVGYDGLSSVDVSVDAISSSYVGSAIDRRDSTDLSASGATVSAPAGYYASSASASVASGTEGTPTATKGTVSSHSIAVTPSVTNSAGYIAGGTHTGTPVSVSASELVSGTYNVTSSGTKDVTNYASASVPSGSATAPATISATGASVSTGTNTLTLSKTVSNTPQVSAGYVSSGTAGNSSVSLTASVTTQAAQAIHPSTTDQSIASGTYLTGTQTIKAVTLANLTADNIKSGVTVKVGDSTDDDCVASVLGTYSGGGGGGGLTLLKTTSLGSLSTSSTSATDTGKSMTLTNYNDYDMLLVDVSVDTSTNNRHTSTVTTVYVTGTSNVATKNNYSVSTYKWNSRLSSGTGVTRTSTSAYGIYVNSASVSNSTMTLTFYYRYSSTYTGTINGNYTARVYGVKLYELIGG